MLVHVRKTFLNDLKQSQLEIFRHSSEIVRHFEIYEDSAPFRETFDEVADCIR